MASLCPRCGLASQAEASYCYFDGSALPGATHHGAVDPAQALFAEPFYFPSGAVCQNFDQLALTCQDRWQETLELLRGGGFQVFLARLGRADLLHAAIEAAGAADPDQGVDQFVARLPARNLLPPRLKVAPLQMDLGTLRPGPNPEFKLRLTNEGHRLITGHVVPDCPWLEVEGAPPGEPRLTRFVQEQTVPVRIVGARLAAGQKPRTGKLLISTSAGDAEVTVSCMVPILPFPKGVLRGCTTPREIAVKAKQFPNEAAELFYRGQVQAWYRSNGWVYPVEGEPASGKAAVQQFFEALGLTKPPHVILDTPGIAFQAPAGKTLQQTIHLHTDDKRPIFAFGRSVSPWLTVVGSVSQGNRASIAVEIQVPMRPGAMLETKLEVRSNGNQRFQVPIVVHIDQAEPVEAFETEFAAADRPAAARSAAPRVGCGCLLRAVIAVSLLGVLMSVVIAAAVVLLLHPELLRRSPLVPYAAAIGPETCVVMAIDLDALDRAPPAFEPDVRRLRSEIVQRFADLDLKADELQPSGLFLAAGPGAAPLTVWTFASPLKFGKVTAGRFDAAEGKGPRIYVDRLDPAAACGIDAKGRLLCGTVEGVRAALERERSGQTSPVYTELAQQAKRVTPGAAVWVVGDVPAGKAKGLSDLFGDGEPPPRLTQFRVELRSTPAAPFLLRACGTFPNQADAAAFRESLRRLPNASIPLLPATLDFHDRVIGKAAWEHRDNEMRAEVDLEPSVAQAALRAAVEKLDQVNRDAETALADLAEKQCVPGVRAVKEKDYSGAAKVFEQAVAWYPKYAPARAHLQDARQALAAQQAYAADLQSARDALAADKLPEARGTLDRMKKSRFADAEIAPLEKEWGNRERLARARAALAEARQLVGRGKFAKARAPYQAACDLNPQDRVALGELAAVKLIEEADAAIARADDLLKARQPDDAHRAVTKALGRLLQQAGAPAWREPAFKLQYDRLVKSGAEIGRAVYEAAKAPADEAREKAERLLRMEQFTESEAAFKAAQKHLDGAVAVLDAVVRLEGKSAFSIAESRAIQKDRDAIRLSANTVKGKSLAATGRKKLAEVSATAEQVCADPTLVAPALANLDAAFQAFREAEEHQAGVSKDATRTAEELRRRFGRVLHPVVLDTSAKLSAGDWSFTKGQWSVKGAKDAQWLEAARGEGISLQSAASDWPREFEVAMDFALVDAGGKVNNSLWAYYADPVTLRLLGTGGKTLFQFALGNDEKIKDQRFVRLRLDKVEKSLAKSLPTDQPVRLLLRCTKRDTDGRRILTVKLDDREIGAIVFSNDVQALRLTVSNPDRQALGRNWFVAVYRLDAAWTGAAKEKAKAP